MNKLVLKTTAAFGFAVLVLNSHAVQSSDMKMEPMAMNEAQVKAVDKTNKSITLKHGPIKSKTVEMAPMTMSFPVQKESLLSNVKVGDKIKFTIENVENQATVTALKVQK
jgi:Cu(I)/Ag(I) efflux system periplasmic protein CusF